MSRYVHAVQDNGLEIASIAYGYDNTVGYFIQVFDCDGEIVKDLDSHFNGLSGAELAYELEKLVADYQVAIPASHIQLACLDLPL